MDSTEQIESGEPVNDAMSNVESEGQEAFNKEDLQCRFYRNEWPEIDELVVVSTLSSNCVFRSKLKKSTKMEPTCSSSSTTTARP